LRETFSLIQVYECSYQPRAEGAGPRIL